MELRPMSVAESYEGAMALLAKLGVAVRIWPVPVEVVDTTPFARDRVHASYDQGAVERLHRVLLSTDRVFALYRGRFVGKTSPVHFFWGAFDLAVSRFSGRRNDRPPPGSVMGEAYSHEVISHGFWPGGDWPIGGRVEGPVFYGYAVPEPAGFAQAEVRPRQARYSPKLGEFLLDYEEVRTADRPDQVLLTFLESSYRAAAELAGWNIHELEHPHAALAQGTR